MIEAFGINVWPEAKSILVFPVTVVSVPIYDVLPTTKFLSFKTKFVLLPLDTLIDATTSMP